LVPYSDSVYKTPKTHFDLLLLNCYTVEKLSHLHSTLGCCGRGGKSRGGAGSEQRWHRERAEAAGRKMTGGRSWSQLFIEKN
jgi:hypothetical protein